jgi:hypothetical protein
MLQKKKRKKERSREHQDTPPTERTELYRRLAKKYSPKIQSYRVFSERHGPDYFRCLL